MSTAWSEATERDRQTGAHGRHVGRRSALISRAAGAHGTGARLSREALCGRRSTFGSMCRSGLQASHRRNAFWPPTNTIMSTPWRSKVAPPIGTTSRKAGLVSQVAHLRCTHQKQAQDNHQHLDARKPMPSTARLARAPLLSSDLEARHEGTLREKSGVDRHQGAWERASPSWSRVAERREKGFTPRRSRFWWGPRSF